MYICKVCSEEFNLVNTMPYILRCGHTFCECCIATSLANMGVFECANCNYRIGDSQDLIVNHILCDKTSMIAQGNRRGFVEEAGKFTRLDKSSVKSRYSMQHQGGQIGSVAELQEQLTKPKREQMFAENPSDNFEVKDARTSFFHDFSSTVKSSKETVLNTSTINVEPNRAFAQPQRFAALLAQKAGENPARPHHSIGYQTTPQKGTATLQKIGFRTPIKMLGDDKRERASPIQALNNKQSISRFAHSNFGAQWTKCANPQCQNPRLIMDNHEFDFCGSMCEKVMEGKYSFQASR